MPAVTHTWLVPRHPRRRSEHLGDQFSANSIFNKASGQLTAFFTGRTSIVEDLADIQIGAVALPVVDLSRVVGAIVGVAARFTLTVPDTRADNAVDCLCRVVVLPVGWCHIVPHSAAY